MKFIPTLRVVSAHHGKKLSLVQSRQHETARVRRGGGGGVSQGARGSINQGETDSEGERTARRLRAISHSEKVDSQEKETARGSKHQSAQQGRADSHLGKVDSQEKETVKGSKHQGETYGKGERTLGRADRTVKEEYVNSKGNRRQGGTDNQREQTLIKRE